MITFREVFYASPSSFDDKLDCRNPVRYDLLTDNDILDYYYQESLKINLCFSVEERLNYANEHLFTCKIRDNDFIKKTQDDFFIKYEERSGVLSLATNPKEIKMWKKYGDNHKGFCLVFDGLELLRNIICSGGLVEYKEVLPLIHPKLPLIERMVSQIQFKLKHLQFEGEYRSRIFSPIPLTEKTRTKIIPPKAFKEIILGADMSEIDIKDLINSIPKELEHIIIKKVQIADESIIISNYKH